MKQWRYITVLVACCLAIATANAQDNDFEMGTEGKVKVNLQYNYALPMGGLKNNFIEKGSVRGLSADILYWPNQKWGIGAGFGYQDFYQKYPRGLYKLSDGSDISAVVTNSLQVIPIMAKAMYAPMGGSESFIQPYVSAGAGIGMVNYSQYLGEFGGNEAAGRFTAQAGAGVKIPFSKTGNSGFLLGATYNYTPYNKNNISNISSLNFQAGVQFRMK